MRLHTFGGPASYRRKVMHVLPVKTAISYEVLGNSFAPEPGRMVEKNTAAASRKKRGRPRGGVRPGERLRDYPVLTVRVPPDTRAMFTALCTRRRVPRWMMLRHLIVCFVRNLPAHERRRIVQRRKWAA